MAYASSSGYASSSRRCGTDAASVPVATQFTAPPPHSDQASTTSVGGVSLDSLSERSELDAAGRGVTEAIQWHEMRLGHRIQPYRGYAHCADDVRLLSCLFELVRLPDIEGDSVKLLLRTMKFIRLCDYSAEDICSILAHASVYFHDAYDLCGSHMDASEVGNVLATLMFVAHCYVQDETCPLHVWHQHLFRKYCPLRTLNCAIMRLLEIRRYVLRLDKQDMEERYAILSRSIGRGAGLRPPTAEEARLSPLAAASSASATQQPPAAPLLSRVFGYSPGFL